jgi:enoyl-[acyl-carrier protein] reductase II|tara:strand:- start:660 stop:1589 length:930 start_codon:yes stop_codon:yes gene_type:complete
MNRITEMLGCKYPIIQSPMGWIARSQLASAVSNAGGFGIIETSSGEVDQCKDEIRKMASLTNSPFGVNLPILFLSDESMLEVVIDENIKFVTTSAGDPAKYIHKLKEANIKVFHAVPSLAGALKAVDAGVDGLVVEGTEGGGFKSPEEVGLHVLIQSIRKHTDLPIVAAGGIVDGTGMAAAFAAGADGIQMGTRFVSSLESPVHENFKGAIVNGSEQGTYILNKKSKPCIRALKTELTDKIYEEGQMDMSALSGIKDLYFGGDMNAAPALAGQSIGLITEVLPVEQIIKQTMQEFNSVCESLSNSKFEL